MWSDSRRQALLTNFFQLQANEKISGPVYCDASIDDIERALLDVNLEAESVSVSVPSATNPMRTRVWEICFEAYQHSYDIPLLTSVYTNLQGNNARTWHQMRRQGIHGPGGMNGNFTLSFRENTTSHIAFNASADDMKAALESLDVVNFVNVERSEASDINGFTWTIEFISINYNTPRGYVEEIIRNVKPMTATSLLIGTDVEVVVGSRYAMDAANPSKDGARAGTFGSNAGAAYLYKRIGDEWAQVALLHGNDTDDLDRFGSATDITLDGDLLIIGAPAADMDGLYEIQSCPALHLVVPLHFVLSWLDLRGDRL